MDWYFIHSTVLTERVTGFTIRLRAGTWQQPHNIDYDTTNVSHHRQAKLLRLGLAFAKSSASIKVDTALFERINPHKQMTKQKS